MLRFENQTLPPSDFEAFVVNVATALKEMRKQGIDETSLGELLCWIGQKPEEVADDAWEESIDIDERFDREVDHIIADMTGRIH